LLRLGEPIGFQVLGSHRRQSVKADVVVWIDTNASNKITVQSLNPNLIPSKSKTNDSLIHFALFNQIRTVQALVPICCHPPWTKSEGDGENCCLIGGEEF